MFLAGREEVESHLSGRGEAVQGMTQGFSLRTSGEIPVDVLWEGSPGVVHVFTALPFGVAEARRAQTALAIADLNRRLVVGHFGLIPQLVFQVPVVLNHDGSVSSQVVDRAIATCRATVSQFAETLRRIATADPTPPPSGPTIGSRRIQLTSDERGRLEDAIARDWAPFRDRLAGNLTFEERLQPWWRRHRVVEVQSALPSPSLGLCVVFTPGGECRVLRGHPEVLTQMAAADPPDLLTGESQARAYATYATAWTTDAQFGEMPVTSFDEIPWRAVLHAEERRVVDELRARIGTRVRPASMEPSAEGWRLRSWVVSESRVIEREVLVPADGRLVRVDTVHGDKLPIPPGRVWGIVGGRLVPVQ